MAVGREALGRKAFKTKRITVDEWGGEVIVRGLSTAEYEVVQDAATKGVDVATKSVTSSKAMSVMARAAVAFGWIDDAGDNVLSWPKDGPSLAAEPQRVIEQISKVVFELTGLDSKTADGEPSDPVEQAEKN